jgi:hypothetical protein
MDCEDIPPEGINIDDLDTSTDDDDLPDDMEDAMRDPIRKS